MPVIFLRHTDDNGSDQFEAHDNKINKRGRFRLKVVINDLLEKYGYPSIIFTSAFRRTLDTAKEIKKMSNSETVIYIDNNLSRYFCSREKENPEISQRTRKYDVPVYEEWSDFEKRVNKHLRMLKKKGYINDENNLVICVTHSLVYKHAARVYGIDIPVIIPFMEHFVIHKYSIELPKKMQELRRYEESRRKRQYFKSKKNKKKAKRYM